MFPDFVRPAPAGPSPANGPIILREEDFTAVGVAEAMAGKTSLAGVPCTESNSGPSTWEIQPGSGIALQANNGWGRVKFTISAIVSALMTRALGSRDSLSMECQWNSGGLSGVSSYAFVQATEFDTTSALNEQIYSGLEVIGGTESSRSSYYDGAATVTSLKSIATPCRSSGVTLSPAGYSTDVTIRTSGFPADPIADNLISCIAGPTGFRYRDAPFYMSPQHPTDPPEFWFTMLGASGELGTLYLEKLRWILFPGEEY